MNICFFCLCWLNPSSHQHTHTHTIISQQTHFGPMLITLSTLISLLIVAGLFIPEIKLSWERLWVTANTDQSGTVMNADQTAWRRQAAWDTQTALQVYWTYGRWDHVRAPDTAAFKWAFVPVLCVKKWQLLIKRAHYLPYITFNGLKCRWLWNCYFYNGCVAILRRLTAPRNVFFFLSSTALNLTAQVKIKVQTTSWGSVLMTGVIYIVLERLRIEEAISEAEVKETNRMPAVWYSISCCYFLLWVFSASRFVLCMRCLLYCYAVYKPASHCYCGIMFLLSQQLQALKLF